MKFGNPVSSVSITGGTVTVDGSVGVTGTVGVSGTVSTSGSTSIGISQIPSSTITPTLSVEAQVTNTNTVTLLAIPTGTTEYLLHSLICSIPAANSGNYFDIIKSGGSSDVLFHLLTSNSGTSGQPTTVQIDMGGLNLGAGIGLSLKGFLGTNFVGAVTALYTTTTSGATFINASIIGKAIT